jgi:hypothetical protein
MKKTVPIKWKIYYHQDISHRSSFVWGKKKLWGGQFTDPKKPVLELKLFLLRSGNQVLEFPFQTWERIYFFQTKRNKKFNWNKKTIKYNLKETQLKKWTPLKTFFLLILIISDCYNSGILLIGLWIRFTKN